MKLSISKKLWELLKHSKKIMGKYITIPDTVYQSSLNTTEMIVYGFIYAMSQKGGSCYARNYVFEKELNMSKQKIQRAIRKLIKENFIVKEMKGPIRHLKPKLNNTVSNLTNNKSNMISKGVINDTHNSVINDTHNNITNNKKNNKLIKESINSFSISSSNQKKVEDILIKCIEYLNKRYLNIADYKIKESEYKHIGFIFELLKSYLGNSIESIEIDDEFYKYLYCFYLDIKGKIYKHDEHKKRKRIYPYWFKNKINEYKKFSFESSIYKNKDYLKFKNELDDNDDFNRNDRSIMHWFE